MKSPGPEFSLFLTASSPWSVRPEELLCERITDVLHSDQILDSSARMMESGKRTVSTKDGLFANEAVPRNDSLTQKNWPDSTFHFSLVRSFFRSHRRVSQSYAESRTLSLILANEKQESIATVSMKIKRFISFVAPSLSFSQSVTLGLPWIYTLSTVVLFKSAHNHEVAAVCLPWTTVLRWPLARSFENEKLRIVHHTIHRWTTL